MTALINPVVPAEDKEKVDAIFKGIEDHLGYVPDGLRLYSTSPPLLEAFVGSVGYFMAHATLSQELLAMIRYLVSSDANCSFCIDFNAGFLISMGKTQQQLSAAQENAADAPLSDKDKVLLNIALAAIDHPEGIDKADIDHAVDHGFTERDVFDAVVIAANNKAFTHVLRAFKVESQGAFS